MTTDLVKLNIHDTIYEQNREKLMENSEYFKSMFTNFAEKSAKTVKINLQDNYNEEIINAFFNFVNNDVLNTSYAYYIYQLSIYFAMCKTIMNNFEKSMTAYKGNIDINTLLSLFYLSKEVSYIDLPAIISSCTVDENYLNLHELFYDADLEFDDFISLYDLWSKNIIPLNKHRKYLPVDIMKLNLKYMPYTSVYFENPLNTYQEGEEVIVDMKQFEQNLQDFAYGLIFDIKDKNIVISGGAVLASLLKKPLATNNSDIDFWIYGDNGKETLKYLIRHIEDKFDIPILYGVRGSVITLCIPDYKRNIQIIFTNMAIPYDIISKYDMDYCECFYDGNSIYVTARCAKSLQTQCIDATGLLTYPRIYKGYKKGFAYLNKLHPISALSNSALSNSAIDCTTADAEEDEVDVKNVHQVQQMDDLSKKPKVRENINKYYCPTISELDNVERLKFMIKNTLNSTYVVVSSSELYKSFTYKIFDTTIDPYFMRDSMIDREQILDSLKFRGPYLHGNLFLVNPIQIETPLLEAPFGISKFNG